MPAKWRCYWDGGASGMEELVGWRCQRNGGASGMEELVGWRS